MIQLKSRWTKDVNEDHVLPEYPRPTLVREWFQNLSGLWDYAISEEEINGLMTYDREVDRFEEETIWKLNQKLYEVYKKSCEG